MFGRKSSIVKTVRETMRKEGPNVLRELVTGTVSESISDAAKKAFFGTGGGSQSQETSDSEKGEDLQTASGRGLKDEAGLFQAWGVMTAKDQAAVATFIKRLSKLQPFVQDRFRLMLAQYANAERRMEVIEGMAAMDETTFNKAVIAGGLATPGLFRQLMDKVREAVTEQNYRQVVSDFCKSLDGSAAARWRLFVYRLKQVRQDCWRQEGEVDPAKLFWAIQGGEPEAAEAGGTTPAEEGESEEEGKVGLIRRYRGGALLVGLYLFLIFGIVALLGTGN